MSRYGKASKAHLAQCHPQLQLLFNEVIKHWDHCVIDGARTIEEQRKNVAKGVSKTMKSKHLPQADGKSHAVDAMPYLPDRIPWNAIQRGLTALKKADPKMELAKCYAFIGFVQGVAAARGIKVRPGADWDSDREFGDHSFIDLPHTELTIA